MSCDSHVTKFISTQVATAAKKSGYDNYSITYYNPSVIQLSPKVLYAIQTPAREAASVEIFRKRRLEASSHQRIMDNTVQYGVHTKISPTQISPKEDIPHIKAMYATGKY